MNNKQLFDLRYPLQQNLILDKSCFNTAIIMQNRTAMQWQPKIPKERKLSKSNEILEESTKKFKTSSGRKIRQQHPGSTIVAFAMYGKKNVDGKWRFVVKVPNHSHPASPPEVYPMLPCLDETHQSWL